MVLYGAPTLEAVFGNASKSLIWFSLTSIKLRVYSRSLIAVTATILAVSSFVLTSFIRSYHIRASFGASP